MKRVICFIIPIIIITALCKAQVIEVDTIVYKTKGKVISATYVDGYIYYLDKENDVYKIYDSVIHIKISKPDVEFDRLANKNDKLIGKEFHYIPRKSDRYTEYLYNGMQFKKVGVFKNIEDVRYEDDDYFITSVCNGEWGGAVYFKSKQNKKTYECAATCLLVVNKIADSYYITATLAHLMGFTEVLKVDNPLDLELSKKKIKKETEGSVARKGVVSLIDEAGVLALTSFVYQKELYHIVVDGFGISPPTTNLVKIKDGKFEIIHRIADEMLWASDAVVCDDRWFLEVSGDDSRETFLLRYNSGKISVIKFERE